MKCLEHKTDTKIGGNGVSLFFYVQPSDHLSCRHESCVFSGLEKKVTCLEATYRDLELPFNCRFQNVSDSTYKKTSMIWHLHQIISFFHHDGPCFLFISVTRFFFLPAKAKGNGHFYSRVLRQYLHVKHHKVEQHQFLGNAILEHFFPGFLKQIIVDQRSILGESQVFILDIPISSMYLVWYIYLHLPQKSTKCR